jgi:hypothetical protein
MPPIITIDTSSSPVYVYAHHSTHGLTTLLDNDQLILLEVQGTLEYNLDNSEKVGDIKLGDISWDETVCLTFMPFLTGQASRAYLHIGHHRMVGRLQSLKTPLAVIVDKPESAALEDKEWQLYTIIRKKLVFDIRPEPVFPDEPPSLSLSLSP